MAKVTLLVLSLILAVCRAAGEGVQLEPYEYTCQGQRIQAELGRFVVPECHEKRDGHEISLAFIRLKSTSAQPGPPIVYLAGGPGGSGIELAKGPRGQAFLAMREVGDVIALDQRGVGLSQPNLACPGSLDFPLTVPGDMQAMLARFWEKSSACASFWREHGVDLSAYNVVESAHDLDCLRRALGARTIRLWGSSYGTFLAFAVIRHYGDVIDRAVLSGVEGPDHTLKLPSTTARQLKVLAKLVAADPAIRRDIGNFGGLVARVLRTAQQKPFDIPVGGTQSTSSQSVKLGRFDLEQLIMAMTGDRAGLEQLPRMLLAFGRGDFSSPLVQTAARLVITQRPDRSDRPWPSRPIVAREPRRSGWHASKGKPESPSLPISTFPCRKYALPGVYQSFRLASALLYVPRSRSSLSVARCFGA
jgi:pimeloyl-ACP methyl ester carboxylesterase